MGCLVGCSVGCLVGFVYEFVCLFVRLFVGWLVGWVGGWLVCWFAGLRVCCFFGRVCSFVRLFVCTFGHLVVWTFVRSFVHSFNHSINRSTASPVRLLQRALVISVRKHTSQFRSSGKCEKYCASSTLIPLSCGVPYLSSEKCVRARAFLMSSGLSVNSSNHSGRSRKRSSESRLPFLFFFKLIWYFWAPVSWCVLVTSLRVCC